MNRALRTLWAGGATVGLTGMASTAVAFLSFINSRAADPVVFFWADNVLKASGVRSVARGVDRLPAGNFVLVLNHQSNFDVMVLFRHVHRHMRFVAKAQLRKLPVFGFAAEKAGNIFVDRDGGGGDKSKLHEAAKKVREQVSVCFFAEGTRSDDGQLRPFKKGAAIMALEAQVPLVPAAIAGTHRILEKGSAIIHARPAALVVGTPIVTAGLSLDARDELTQRAHDEVRGLLGEANQLVAELETSGG